MIQEILVAWYYRITSFILWPARLRLVLIPIFLWFSTMWKIHPVENKLLLLGQHVVFCVMNVSLVIGLHVLINLVTTEITRRRAPRIIRLFTPEEVTALHAIADHEAWHAAFALAQAEVGPFCILPFFWDGGVQISMTVRMPWISLMLHQERMLIMLLAPSVLLTGNVHVGAKAVQRAEVLARKMAKKDGESSRQILAWTRAFVRRQEELLRPLQKAIANAYRESGYAGLSYEELLKLHREAGSPAISRSEF